MMEDLFTDPQIAFRGIWGALDHPGMSRHHYKAPSFVLPRTPGRPRRPAPCLGEHTWAVLVNLLGLTEAEVATVEAQGSLA
jgi:crotonobetainyl-CoA:carnitine CoA-transferase CaiB-like acyl-CoA transferase